MSSKDRKEAGQLVVIGDDRVNAGILGGCIELLQSKGIKGLGASLGANLTYILDLQDCFKHLDNANILNKSNVKHLLVHAKKAEHFSAAFCFLEENTLLDQGWFDALIGKSAVIADLSICIMSACVMGITDNANLHRLLGNKLNLSNLAKTSKLWMEKVLYQKATKTIKLAHFNAGIAGSTVFNDAYTDVAGLGYVATLQRLSDFKHDPNTTIKDKKSLPHLVIPPRSYSGFSNKIEPIADDLEKDASSGFSNKIEPIADDSEKDASLERGEVARLAL